MAIGIKPGFAIAG